MYSKIDYMTVQEHKDEGDWPFTWLPVIELLPYIRRLGPNTTGIEIGVARGESSYAILENCQNVTKLYGVDPYLAYKDWNGPVDQEHNDKTKQIAMKNLQEFDGRFVLGNQTSDEFRKTLGDEKVNFIYVDGDHSYDGVKKDLGNYYDCVSKGGIFAGHDFNLKNVRQALDDFRQERKIRLPIRNLANNTWFWYV